MNKPIRTFTLRSFVAAVVGWFVPPAIVYLLPLGSGGTVIGPTDYAALNIILAHFAGYLFFVGMMACWVVPSWLLLVLPMVLFIPQDSGFWRAWVIVPFGFAMGATVFVLSIVVIERGPGVLDFKAMAPMATLAGIVGLVIAGMLNRSMRKKPNQPPQPTRFARG